MPERSSSRLLVLDRASGAITHTKFERLIEYLEPGDCLVLNDTKVIPARLIGTRQSGGSVELLLLKRLGGTQWEALARPARRVKAGDVLSFGNGTLCACVTRELPDGIRHVEMRCAGIFEEVLEALGETPLPPYITRKLLDKSRYQTVYAKEKGSAAAPTAGLHFTDALLGELTAKGIKIAKITLHVGLGTFRPIKAQNILEHDMHSEHYRIDAENAALINGARGCGGKIVCVGTTTVRTLETVAAEFGEIAASEGETDIFIYPGHRFIATDSLITNFHLPESTLVALVAAFAGTGAVMEAYRQAVDMRYRFFSFGDAMLIV